MALTSFFRLNKLPFTCSPSYVLFRARAGTRHRRRYFTHHTKRGLFSHSGRNSSGRYLPRGLNGRKPLRGGERVSALYLEEAVRLGTGSYTTGRVFSFVMQCYVITSESIIMSVFTQIRAWLNNPIRGVDQHNFIHRLPPFSIVFSVFRPFQLKSA